jgi:hypothetical protein
MIKDVIIHEISLFGRGVPLACVVFSAAAAQPGNTGRRRSWSFIDLLGWV